MKKYLFPILLVCLLLCPVSQVVQAESHIQKNGCSCEKYTVSQDSVFWTVVGNSDFLKVQVGKSLDIIDSSSPQLGNYWNTMDYISEQDSVFAILNKLVCSKIEQSSLESLLRLNFDPIMYKLYVNPSTGEINNVCFYMNKKLKKYFPDESIKSIFTTVMNILFKPDPLLKSSLISINGFLTKKNIREYLYEVKTRALCSDHNTKASISTF